MGLPFGVRFSLNDSPIQQQREYKNMKKYISLRNFFIAAIPVVIILIPLVYASNQSTQVKAGVDTSNKMSMIENKTEDIPPLTIFDGVEEPTAEATFIPVEKVRRGIVQTIDIKNNLFVIKVDGKFTYLMSVESNASTTVYFGGGEKAEMNDIDTKMKIYVFGLMKTDNSVIVATKIIIANESRLLRK